MPIGIHTNQVSLPPWMEDAYKDITGRAAAHAKSPYAPYGQPRIADQSKNPLWQEYYKRTQQNQGQYQPFLEQSNQFLNRGAERFPDNYQNYMNPYMENVLNSMAHYGNRNFSENILPALQSQFISMGQHGSGQHKEFAQRAARDYGEGLAREQGNALAQGYGQAGKQFNEDQSRQFLGAEGAAQLGRMSQAGGLADLASLQEAGGHQINAEQQKLNTGYEDFLRQQQDPMNRIAQESNILQGVPIMGQNLRIDSPAPKATVNDAGNIGSIAGQLYGGRMYGGNRKKGGSINMGDAIKKKTKAIHKNPFGISHLKFNSTNSRRR